MDNIDYKEKYYSELTFHYWFWKNEMKSLDKNNWIGFCQKRRFWIKKDILKKDINIYNIKNYILIFIFGFFSIFLLISKSKLIDKVFSYNFNFLLIIILCSMPGMLLFYIAVDSGRWTSMLYHMVAIFYFGMLKLRFAKINPNLNFRFVNFNNIKNNFLFYFLIFLLGFGWSPKAVFHESFGTFLLIE